MISTENILLLLILGLISGFINVVAGGGSTLTIPGLIYTGLEASVANGTNRIAIFIQSITAVATLWHEVKNNLRFYLKLSILTMPGSIAGAFLAIKISDKLLEVIIGIVMILIIASIVYPFKKIKKTEPDNQINYKVTISLILAGLYGGFLQIGVGFILMAIFHRQMKFDLVRVNIMKVFVVSFFTLPALIVFIANDKVVFIPGLVLALGNAVGAWLSAKLSIKKGEKFIRFFLIVASVIIAIDLLGVF